MVVYSCKILGVAHCQMLVLKSVHRFVGLATCAVSDRNGPKLWRIRD